MRQGNARIIVIHPFVFGLSIFLSLLVKDVYKRQILFLVGKPLGRKQNIGIESRETMAKILAVDDEPAILEMICLLYTSVG